MFCATVALTLALIGMGTHFAIVSGEDKTRLTPIECYVGRTLAYKGTIRGDFYGMYHSGGHSALWKFTDHQTGKVVKFGGFCATGPGRYVLTSTIEGASK